jgi:mono/diheme cytochrome c family protein
MKRTMLGLGLLCGVTLLFTRTPLGAEPDALFNQKCASCHGKDGQAQTAAGKSMKIKSWRDDEALKKMSDTRLKEIIRDGVKEGGKVRMPANKALKDEQVDELAKKVRSLNM